MRVFLLICLFASAIAAQTMPAIEPGVSQDLAKWRSSQYSNISYKLNLTLEKMSPVLRGSMEIQVTQASTCVNRPDAGDCPPYEIILDWRKIPGHEKDSTISNVSLNSTALKELPADNYVFSGTPFFQYQSDHLIFRNFVRMGENVIKLDFTSPILTSGSAITRYVDKEDGAEYIYSLFVPSDASTAFPVFDQPDLKARFTLDIIAPLDWETVSNGAKTCIVPNEKIPTDKLSEFIQFQRELDRKNPMTRTDAAAAEAAKCRENISAMGTTFSSFRETQPISSYLFAFAAGEFAKFPEDSALPINVRPFSNSITETTNSSGSSVVNSASPTPNVQPPATAGGTDKNAEPATSIYVRKSQAAKFKPHAAEVFRLNREAVKYLETYFDYKFPFPKYDLVLIPEFPFGGMEHAGATFLREQSVIFPQEPTKNDIISRANLIFHEAAHQWFGDCVTMKWFDDLWLKEGFAEFMAYKTLEKVMPDSGAWKVFYERNKRAAYATDSTKGTTPIYQPIANLNSAKSAYGNIVYRKAPSFLRQAEFYLGEDKFQTAVRAFLKKHEFGNAGWEDLVKEFEDAAFASRISGWTYFPKMPKNEQDEFENRFRQVIKGYAECWVKQRGVARIKGRFTGTHSDFEQESLVGESEPCEMAFVLVEDYGKPPKKFESKVIVSGGSLPITRSHFSYDDNNYIFPNYRDYGYGIFLLDDKSRDYVLKNIGREKDDFLRTMMWGSLWDSVREAELDPKDYVELVIKNIGSEKDEGAIQTLLSRVTTAMNYYMSEPPASAGGQKRAPANWPAANAAGSDLRTRLEALLIDKIQNASTQGQRITYYRAFLNIASTERARNVLKQILKAGSGTAKSSNQMTLKTKDKFDIVTRLIILGDPEAPALLAALEKTETSDDARRYAYAAKAGIPTAENKAKFWNDFLNNKDISESWIESAIDRFNSIRHAELTQQYLTRALAELPNLKRSRKIFFVNDWLEAFIGGQKSEEALAAINKFLSDNPNLDNDLRLKILENSDLIERAVKIRAKYSKN